MRRQSNKLSFVCPQCGAKFTRWPAEMRKRKTPITHCSFACHRAAIGPLHFPGVYAIVHVKTGLIYVGASRNIQTRWRNHLGELRRGTNPIKPLQTAFDNEGRESLEWRVLERLEDASPLHAREQFWIDRMGAADPALGFNMQPTAGNATGMKMPASAIAALRARSIGKSVSAEARRKISEANRGRQTRLGKISYRVLSDDQVRYVRERLANGAGQRALARELGVGHTVVAAIAQGRSYQTVT